MAKVLKASFEKNCVGCDLCVSEAQRQLGKVGLEGAPIRVFRNEDGKGISFTVDLDPSVNKLDIERIEKVCPALVFTLEDGEAEHHELAD